MHEERYVFEVRRAVFGLHLTLDEGCDWPAGRVRIQSLWGPHPLWDDIIAALWSDCVKEGKDTLGERLWQWSREAAAHRRYYWRLEYHRGMSGAQDWRVRIQDEVAAEWGTAGAISSALHMSSRGKTPQLICPIEDLYLYLDEVPGPEDPDDLYRDTPPRLIHCGGFEWNMPHDARIIRRLEPLGDGAADEEPVELSHAELAAIRTRLHEEYEGDGGEED